MAKLGHSKTWLDRKKKKKKKGLMTLLYLGNTVINFCVDEDNNRAIDFGGVPFRCIMLKQLQKELIKDSQPNLLNFKNLQQVIFKQLFP